MHAGGAVLVTVGLSSRVYALTAARQDGWTAGKTIVSFVGSLVLLTGFIVWELRHPEPLMRFGILRRRAVSAANAQQIGAALGIAALSTIAASRTEDALAGGSSHAAALVQGFHTSFYVAVGVALIGIVDALTLVRREPAAGAEVAQLPVRETVVLDLAA
jgi:predicted small integral membrane protein